MVLMHIVFEDVSSGERWDTDAGFTADDDDQTVSEGSARYSQLVEHAAENIWGNMCRWNKSGRYDTGRVVKPVGLRDHENITGILKVSMKKI